ncbi:hypothetical protein KACC15558_35120 [Brevibacterium ammoniilyticum]|uniref:Uncharacterized protein n=2 Tax=Brevibacterium ammoniilyticum TaxID=1046555 RepID=A0ABP9UAS9_9MICO
MRAIREDGEAVELDDDGSWKLIQEESRGGELGFRGVRWGTRPQSAKRREETEPSEENQRMLYWTGAWMGTLMCDVVYLYAHDVLVRGKYIIDENWVNENRYLMEFSTLKNLLATKYGNPVEDLEFWNNDLWRDNYDDWGKAVEQGHLSMYVTWYSGDTRIILSLAGEKYTSILAIEYASLKLESLESKLTEASVLDIL